MDYFKRDDLLKKIWRAVNFSSLPEGFRWRIRIRPSLNEHEIVEAVIQGKFLFGKNSMSIDDRRENIYSFDHTVAMGNPISRKYDFISSPKSISWTDTIHEYTFPIFGIVQWKAFRGNNIKSSGFDYDDGNTTNINHKNLSSVLVQSNMLSALFSPLKLLDVPSISTNTQQKRRKGMNIREKLGLSSEWKDANSAEGNIEILKWQLSGLDKSYEKLEERVKKLESLNK